MLKQSNPFIELNAPDKNYNEREYDINFEEVKSEYEDADNKDEISIEIPIVHEQEPVADPRRNTAPQPLRTELIG